jgi:hypothetical protein
MAQDVDQGVADQLAGAQLALRRTGRGGLGSLVVMALHGADILEARPADRTPVRGENARRGV